MIQAKWTPTIAISRSTRIARSRDFKHTRLSASNETLWSAGNVKNLWFTLLIILDNGSMYFCSCLSFSMYSLSSPPAFCCNDGWGMGSWFCTRVAGLGTVLICKEPVKQKGYTYIILCQKMWTWNFGHQLLLLDRFWGINVFGSTLQVFCGFRVWESLRFMFSF